MTASIRIMVALGALVALALVLATLASLASAPQADASTHTNGSINGIPKEKLLQGICTRANNREVFRVINPYHHRSKMQILAQGADKRFHMKRRSTRRVITQMAFFPGPDPDA